MNLDMLYLGVATLLVSECKPISMETDVFTNQSSGFFSVFCYIFLNSADQG
jgi:hypothetical protein